MGRQNKHHTHRVHEAKKVKGFFVFENKMGEKILHTGKNQKRNEKMQKAGQVMKIHNGKESRQKGNKKLRAEKIGIFRSSDIGCNCRIPCHHASFSPSIFFIRA